MGFEFGIRGYQPRRLSSRREFTREHGRRLGALVGRVLVRGWVVWDRDDNSWFADCPVVLDFDGERAEVNHWKFDEVSLTWNTIDLRRPISWPGSRLRWRDDAVAGLVALHGDTVRAVELIEWRLGSGDLADGSLALGFTFDGGGECVLYNAMDENGILFGPPGDGHVRHRLG